MLRRIIITCIAAVALAGPAHATGYYDEWGYQHEGDATEDEEGVCTLHGGKWGEALLPGEHIDHLQIYVKYAICNDGTFIPLTEEIFGLSGEGDVAPPPPSDPAGEQLNECVEPPNKASR